MQNPTWAVPVNPLPQGEYPGVRCVLRIIDTRRRTVCDHQVSRGDLIDGRGVFRLGEQHIISVRLVPHTSLNRQNGYLTLPRQRQHTVASRESTIAHQIHDCVLGHVILRAVVPVDTGDERSAGARHDRCVDRREVSKRNEGVRPMASHQRRKLVATVIIFWPVMRRIRKNK